MPFYKFGSLIFLGKIQENYWIPFIQKQFRNTNKKITKKLAREVASLTKNHPYYVQQLAQLCWLRSEKEATESVIEDALDSLVLQLSLLFQNITESLTTNQVNYLKALLDEQKMFSSKKTIEKYKLGTSANVTRIKKALIDKEIIDDSGNKIEMLDPIFAIWLKKYYFKS